MFDKTALVDEVSRLKKFTYKLTGNASDADDLLQATLLRALEKEHLFQNGTNLFGWTSKIMFNIFVSEYRRKKKFESRYDPDTYLNRLVAPESQETELELSRVQDAMNKLSEVHRDILVMVCVKGMSYLEVANLLKLPVGTVRSRLSRARESLQKEMGAEVQMSSSFGQAPQAVGRFEQAAA